MLDPAVQMTPYHHPVSPVPHQFQVTEPKATLLAKQSEVSGNSGELPWGGGGGGKAVYAHSESPAAAFTGSVISCVTHVQFYGKKVLACTK